MEFSVMQMELSVMLNTGKLVIFLNWNINLLLGKKDLRICISFAQTTALRMWYPTSSWHGQGEWRVSSTLSEGDLIGLETLLINEDEYKVGFLRICSVCGSMWIRCVIDDVYENKYRVCVCVRVSFLETFWNMVQSWRQAGVGIPPLEPVTSLVIYLYILQLGSKIITKNAKRKHLTLWNGYFPWEY